MLAEAGFMKLSRSLIINSAAVVRLEVRNRDAAFLHMVGLAEALALGRCAAQRARRGLVPTAAKPASLAGSSQMQPDSSLVRCLIGQLPSNPPVPGRRLPIIHTMNYSDRRAGRRGIE